MNEELIIDEKNFAEHFFDVRQHRPSRGQVMAVYRASAILGSGQLKKNLIDLLRKDKAEAATKVMHKLGCATQQESVRICREIVKDMLFGLTEEEVENKEYQFVLESFYYTKKENIPLDDPHWSVVSLKNLDEFLDSADQRITLKGKVLSDEESPKI